MASITVQLHELEQVIHVFDPLSLTGDIEVKKETLYHSSNKTILIKYVNNTLHKVCA